MAGWGLYDGRTAVVRILEDNGNPNVRYWRQVGSGTDSHLASDSDEWVRWTSGEVPMTPGRQYAEYIPIPEPATLLLLASALLALAVPRRVSRRL